MSPSSKAGHPPATVGDRPVVRAAGGVVWRRRSGTVEVVFVHRCRQDDWSLPKGKLEPGERHRDAALREVYEETGLRCELREKLRDSDYLTLAGEHKVIRWWAMTVLVDEGLVPNKETDEVRWVPMDRVSRVATYDLDRVLVHSLDTSTA